MRLKMQLGDHQQMVVKECPDLEGKTYCADTWCTGKCGLPALTLLLTNIDGINDLKAHGSAVACGPVWQRFRVKWTGEKVFVPEFLNQEELLKLMWW